MVNPVPSYAGTSILHMKDAVRALYGESVLREGLSRLDPEVRSQLEHATPMGWVPADSLAQAIEAWSGIAGVGGDDMTVRCARHATTQTLTTVWRLFLSLTTDAALITRAPILYSKTRNVGELTVEGVEKGRARLVVRGWPGMSDRQLLSLCTNVETLLDLTGRKGPSAHAKRTADGGVIELRWR